MFALKLGATLIRFGLALAIMLSLLLTAPRSGSAQGDEEAVALLDTAVETMRALESFRFDLTTPHGTSVILNNLELAGVTGAVQRPDRFQATITARVAVATVAVEMIGIGDRLWVTDPLAPAGSFIELSAEDAPDPTIAQTLTELINPDRLFLAAVGLVRDPEIDGTETIDGVRTTRVVGTVDLSSLPQFAATLDVATPQPVLEHFVFEEMPITVWIDGEGRVVALEAEGPLTVDESPDVVRRLDLYDFNEPVDIIEPETATPAAS
jgi:hypothetical protein